MELIANLSLGLATALTALFEVALMVTLGYLMARLLGWTQTESLFAGAAVGISSTMLVARATSPPERSSMRRSTPARGEGVHWASAGSAVTRRVMSS